MAILEGHGVRSTNIADLRNHLTRYLKEVRAGEEIASFAIASLLSRRLFRSGMRKMLRTRRWFRPG
jgi:hypothetical protein